jgi:hypothetical protein
VEERHHDRLGAAVRQRHGLPPSFEYFYSRIQYFRSELPGRNEKDEEKYASGYVVPPEAAYGKHYAQWLPDRRAEEARKRGTYQREGLTPQVDGFDTSVHDDQE